MPKLQKIIFKVKIPPVMAEIKAIKAWRYNPFLSENLKELTAPLSETVLRQRQETFYKLPFHHYHISSPIDVPPYHNAQRRVENWQLDKVIQPDSIEGIYVYYQEFGLKRKDTPCVRKGFICHIKSQEYDQNIVLPHEMTIQRAVDYRTELLQNTQMHTLPTHGFYTDKHQSLEAYMDESMLNPIYELIDGHETRHRLSVIHDRNIIRKFIAVLHQRQVWIADGHHRYQSSVQYRQQQMKENPNHRGDEAYNYHLMWLTNTESSDLGILPTHRIIHSVPDFDEADFLNKLRQYFSLEEVEPDCTLGLAPTENLWTFMVVLKNRRVLIKLKPEAFEQFDGDLPQVVKELDLSVLHHFILEKTLGLKAQQQFDHLDFSQYLNRCFSSVEKGQAQFAVLTRQITAREIRGVSFSGHIMPAKSTYFFPKVLGGLVFSSLAE